MMRSVLRCSLVVTNMKKLQATARTRGLDL
jgi:hypothetical protein